jgi:hypothetical protein
MGRKSFLTLALAAIAGAAAIWIPASATGAQPTGAVTSTPLDAADFVAVIDNPYYPLPVGRVLTYEGVRDGVRQTERVTVTDRTKLIQGVTATVVTDVAKHGSRLLERTTDWFAQDTQGNVWYLGERTAAYEPDGTVDTSGSWLTGVDGARAGIIMEADPRVPDAYRQEFLKGEAEDTAWIVDRGGKLQVPYATVHRILTTLEASVVEPGVYDQKIYAPGLGIVAEHALAGDEDAALVSVSPAP